MQSSLIESIRNYALERNALPMYVITEIPEDLKLIHVEHGSEKFATDFLHLINEMVEETEIDVARRNHLANGAFDILSYWLINNQHFESGTYKLICDTINQEPSTKMSRKMASLVNEVFINQNGVDYFNQMYEVYGKSSFGKFKRNLKGINSWIELQLEVDARSTLSSRSFPYNQMIDSGKLTFEKFKRIKNVDMSTGSSINNNLVNSFIMREDAPDDPRWLVYVFDNIGLKTLSNSYLKLKEFERLHDTPGEFLKAYYNACYRLLVRPNRVVVDNGFNSLSHRERELMTNLSNFILNKSEASRDDVIELFMDFIKKMPILFEEYIVNNSMNVYSTPYKVCILATMMDCSPDDFSDTSSVFIDQMVDSLREDISLHTYS